MSTIHLYVSEYYSSFSRYITSVWIGDRTFSISFSTLVLEAGTKLAITLDCIPHSSRRLIKCNAMPGITCS